MFLCQGAIVVDNVPGIVVHDGECVLDLFSEEIEETGPWNSDDCCCLYLVIWWIFLTAPLLFFITVVSKGFPIEAYACKSAAHKPTSSSLDPSANGQHNQVEF